MSVIYVCTFYADVCLDVQRRMPFWVIRRLLPGVAFDDVYAGVTCDDDDWLVSAAAAAASSSSSSHACIWACESEDGAAVCFKVDDDDDWFRCVWLFGLGLRACCVGCLCLYFEL